jgi:hypothetical protein
MTSRSKIKGSSFEREVAKYLSELYNLSFIRNISGSGAYVGGKNFHRKSTLSDSQILSARGDIHCPESFSLLNIECKSYAAFAWHQLFDESKQLESWIDQLMTVSDVDSLNMLCFKITRQGRYIAVPAKVSIIHHQRERTGMFIDINHVCYTTRLYGVWNIYPFESFLKSYRETVALLSSKNQLENSNQPVRTPREALEPSDNPQTII